MLNDRLSDVEVENQLEAIPKGPRRELARWMSAIYESDFGYSWAPEPTWDLLSSKPLLGVFGETVISDEDKKHLSAMRDDAGGWFYEKNGELKFVTLAEWEKVKSGERAP